MDAVRDQTRNLAACLGDLTREPWEAPSLCSGWRVRDVLAHVTAGAKGAYRPPAIPAGLLRHRLDYNRWIAQDGRARGQEDPAAILAAFRTTAQLITARTQIVSARCARPTYSSTAKTSAGPSASPVSCPRRTSSRCQTSPPPASSSARRGAALQDSRSRPPTRASAVCPCPV